MATSYTNLERNIMNEIGVEPLSFDANQDISTYATFNFIYVSSITLIIAAAAVMYIIAGGWRIEASERGIRKSNETFKRVTLGLLGVLSLFVILYTVNKDLLLGDVGLSALKTKVQGGTGEVVPAISTTQPVQTNGTEQANRDALQAAGISVNKGPCTEEQVRATSPNGPPPNCTNLADLPSSAISMLIQLKDSCPGSTVVVTGGTEPGHKTHRPGAAVVDLRMGTGALDGCIKNPSKFNKVSPTPGFCRAAYSGLGFMFCDEKGVEHWHVSN
jgi:hypothetical protein